jgi:hypothetical protein
MALTADQQSQLEFQLALENARQENTIKLDAIRLAQQILIENARSKPVAEREITPEAIATFANALIAATNS